MESKHRLKKGQRIRLKGDGQDNVYEFAHAGAEGWVTALHIDEVGYPMVAVHWDTEHWTYNGEDDTITFEDHFDPVDEGKPMGEDNTDPFVDWLLKSVGTTEEEARAEFEQSQEEYEEEPYTKDLGDAYDAAFDGEAYVMLVLERQEIPDGEGSYSLIPKVYQNSRTTQGTLLAQMYLSQTATNFHEAIVKSVLRRIDGSVDFKE